MMGNDANYPARVVDAPSSTPSSEDMHVWCARPPCVARADQLSSGPPTMNTIVGILLIVGSYSIFRLLMNASRNPKTVYW